MSNIGSDVPSYHTESTVLDAVYFAENPRPTQREAYIASMCRGKSTDEKIEGLAGAIYDHRVYARVEVKEAEDRMNKRFDTLENLLRGFVTEVREQFSEVREQFSVVTTRLDTVVGRLDAIDDRLDAIDGRLDAMDDRLEAIDDRLEALETQSDTLTGVLDEHVKSVKEYFRAT